MSNLKRIAMLRCLSASVAVAAIFCSTSAFATCPTFHTLTNGTTADATQVMDNFNNVLCAPSFTGPVGIGTTTPTTTLQVNGTISDGAISSGDYILRNSLAGGVSPGSSADREAAFGITTYNTLSEGGGTYSPMLLGRSNNSGNYAFYFGFNGIYAYSVPVTTNASALLDGTSAKLYFGLKSDGTTYFSAGNVGIGTSTPSQALEVNGQLKVDSFASAASTAVCQNGNVLSSCSSSIRYKENVRNSVRNSGSE